MTLEQIGAMDFDIYVEFVQMLTAKLEREMRGLY